jgi:tetratricopeptide (TPR) repeat protein
MYLAAATALLLSIACAGRATVATESRDTSDQSASVADAMRIVQRAFEDARHNNTATADAELDEALHSPGFGGLPEDVRYQTLLMASLVASETGQNKKTHDLAVKATGFPQADDMAWIVRFSSAFTIQDYDDAALSLTKFAQRWPAKLDNVEPGAVMQLHYRLKLAHADEADRLMLDELFDAGWQNNGVEPSHLWRDLALRHLERGEVARATTVALRVTSGQVALSMRVDKRFDPIALAHADAFDVDGLVAAEITAAKARIAAQPDRLQPITDLQELYLITRQYEKVLSISDAVVSRAERREGPRTYSDFGDHYNWILDNRSRAFKRQGQWDKAIATEVLAARLPEQGGINVSQSINLGGLYAELGKPDEADTAIVQLGDLSPVGQMELEAVKLRIALDRHDEAAAATAMAYLREHRAEELDAWQDALLLRGQLDDAAALLIERLENPSWRSDALVAMQHYAETVETPMEKTIHERWNAITGRPEVQAALQKVGRVADFAIAPGLR